MTSHFRTIIFFLFSAIAVQAQFSSSDLQDLLNRYRQARAESSAFLNIRSVAIIGEIQQGGQTYSFELNQKDTGEIRYTLTLDEETIIQVHDGHDGWRWISGRPELGANLLTDAQLRFFRLNNSFHTPLDRPQLYDFDVRYLGVEINDKSEPEHHVQLSSERFGDTVDVWIDAIDFLEKRRSYRPNEEAEPLVTTFSDYRKVDGIYTPYTMESVFKDKQLARINITKIRRNTGMLSFYFTKPSTYQKVSKEDLN
ncbi:hypothetical protein [Cerasicoccus arenae]|nr:hypothetical protein [Cerasicoccus arenae]MBK1856716.1 hypothetical protein [Cerasicoccus arenae]